MARRKRRHTKQNVANASENMLFITSFGVLFFFCDLFIFELRQHTMPTSDLLKNNNNRKFFFFSFFFSGREGELGGRVSATLSAMTEFL